MQKLYQRHWRTPFQSNIINSDSKLSGKGIKELSVLQGWGLYED